jgi:hypothetical protein
MVASATGLPDGQRTLRVVLTHDFRRTSFTKQASRVARGCQSIWVRLRVDVKTSAFRKRRSDEIKRGTNEGTLTLCQVNLHAVCFRDRSDMSLHQIVRPVRLLAAHGLAGKDIIVVKVDMHSGDAKRNMSSAI